MAMLVGESSVRGSSELVRMVLLTFVAIGITFTWGVEMTYCTPYLLDLGLTKSRTSLIWIAGPLSGLVVQPVVGVVSDGSASRWGRRRPFMLAAAAVVAAGLLLLGFTRELVGLVVGTRDDDDAADAPAARRATVVLAVLAIYLVDFAINVVQSCARSLLVDTLPLERQQTGAAWASRMSAIGHVIGYAAGAVDLVGRFGPALGDSQFKQLTAIAALAMLASTALTCWAVTERVLVPDGGDGRRRGLADVLRRIARTLRHLSPRIRAICWAQFWAWIGWFPFLFYSTTWVGETYYRYDAPPPRPQQQQQAAHGDEDALGDMGRIGSTALFVYSVITFVGAFVLPLLVRSPDDDGFTRRPPPAVARLVRALDARKPDLVTSWMCGHLVFAAAMFMAPLAKSFRFATALMCICALPWALATWAPLALLGVEVNKMSSGYRPLPDDGGDDMELSAPRKPPPPSAATAELSGVYFGILNVFTALPQFVGAFVAAAIFALLEPGPGPDDAPEPATTAAPRAIPACLAVGAASALVAALATRRLKHL